ncbi:PPE domain-containing protein [Mycobacterium sp. D16R24]|uniref:PPE domain-containing protein n=1 Tax=Mycobacterium sp. D16R24 TaxID=1855656 RepID=UPI0009922022|nr:PPE domain-containing protein [Mycobacterium sp. D16R24]
MLGGDAAVLPPGQNHMLMVGAPGTGAAGVVAWGALMQAIADGCAAEAAAKGATTATTAAEWVGVSGTAMATSAVPEIADLAIMAAHCLKNSLLADTLVQVYTTALGNMIPEPVCDGNRMTWGALAGTNVFGQNFPAMGFLDEQFFLNFWPLNSGLRAGYGTAVDGAVSALAVPPVVTAMPANPGIQAAGAAAMQGEQAAQTGVTASMRASAEAASPMNSGVMGQMMQILTMAPSMAGQLAGMLPQLLQTLVQPLMSLPQQAMSLFAPALSSLGQGMSNLGGASSALAASSPLSSVGGAGGGLSAAIGATRPVGGIGTVGGGLGVPAGWSPAATTKTASRGAPASAGTGVGGAPMYGPMGAARRGEESGESHTTTAGRLGIRLAKQPPVVTAGAGEN